MELHVAREILEQVHYQDWTFDVFREGDTLFLQVHFTAPCACRSNRGNLRHRCRKWRISPRSTKSELVQTAFLAVRTAEDRSLAEQKESKVVEGHLMVDHVHMLISIPQIIGYIKGKSAIHVARVFVSAGLRTEVRSSGAPKAASRCRPTRLASSSIGVGRLRPTSE